MKIYKVILSEDASDDIERIYDYICYELDNPGGANKVVDGILGYCEKLRLFPAGSAVRLKRAGFEFRFVHFRNYTVIYYIEGEGVVIHRVLCSFADISKLISG